MKQFSTEEALKFGWATTKKNFVFLLKVLLVIAVIYIIGGFIQKNADGVPVESQLLSILFWVLHVILDIGLIKIALKFVAGQTPDLEDLYNHYPLFVKYILGSLLTLLIVILGFMLLIIPGIIFSIRLQFVSYLIVDKGMGPIDAIKQSWKVTGGNFWNLFIFGIISGFVNVLGLLAIGIGLLWTIPTTSIASAYVYKKLAS